LTDRDALNPYELIIFDFDGTLFDTHASISYCIEKTLGQKVPTKDAVDMMVSTGVGLEDAFRLLEADYSLTPDGPSGWISAYRKIYEAEGLALIQPFPGASALLRSLAATKIPIAIVSNKGISAIEAVLSRAVCRCLWTRW
jgi:phosphoglycolate phosphatase